MSDAGLWCRHTDDSAPQHHWPVNDLIDHDVDSAYANCVCGPVTSGEKLRDGTVRWVITHFSLDGREMAE